MDINELFLSCRKGDLTKVKYLVEQKEVEINIRDCWDSTPLYYACLCGHIDIVHYLLECGARCDANTFDGERCVYGALNSEIRNLLRHNYQVVTSQTLRRDNFSTFLKRFLEDGKYSDVVFNVHGVLIKAHRCILSVRCEYFTEKFMDKWMWRRLIQISHPKVTPDAFHAVLEFIYTGRLEIPLDCVEDVLLVAKQCRLDDLIQQIDRCLKKITSFGKSKPGTRVTTLVVEGDENQLKLQQDFGVLAERALPLVLTTWIAGLELLPNGTFDDINFEVQGQCFLCHKVFFCGRSDYFQVLLSDHFLEASVNDSGVPVIFLHDISIDVFVCILYYLYQNMTNLNADNVYDVLCTADLYLLPGLKRLCGSFMAQHLDPCNVVPAIRTARTFNLPQLEYSCTEFIASNLENVINCSDFHKLVQEDAREVQGRQETDTISVVDDVRYHITKNQQTYIAIAEANEKLAMIDKVLDHLGLEA